MKNDFIVGIDIGTKKISTIISQIKPEENNEKLEIIGYGLSPSRGLKKGVIIDINSAVADIKKSVKDAELMAGVEIESAYINISGSYIKSISGKGSINIMGKVKEISQEDVDRVITQGSGIMLPSDKEILHVIPQQFIVDSHEGIQNPVGMIGNNLEVDLNIITTSRTSINNLLNCLKRAKINVNKIILSHIASAEAVLNRDEKDLGVVLIDIGEGTTDIAIYEKKALCFSTTFGFGGFKFTNDLAIGIRIPIENAEKIKKKYGCGTDPMWKNENIEVPSIGGKKKRMISVTLLEQILTPYAKEIFLNVKARIDKEGYTDSINAGLVITGGSANLNGLIDIADEIFSVPVRIGEPFGLGGLIDKVSSPDFATSIGLLKYGYREMNEQGELRKKPGNLFSTIKDWFDF